MGKADSRAPAIITIILLVFLGYLGFKFIPVYMDNMNLNHEIEEVVNWDRFHLNRPPSSESCQKEIISRAAQLGVQLRPEQVRVAKTDKNLISATVTYSRTIELPGYGPYVWAFKSYVTEREFRTH